MSSFKRSSLCQAMSQPRHSFQQRSTWTRQSSQYLMNPLWSRRRQSCYVKQNIELRKTLKLSPMYPHISALILRKSWSPFSAKAYGRNTPSSCGHWVSSPDIVNSDPEMLSSKNQKCRNDGSRSIMERECNLRRIVRASFVHDQSWTLAFNVILTSKSRQYIKSGMPCYDHFVLDSSNLLGVSSLHCDHNGKSYIKPDRS